MTRDELRMLARSNGAFLEWDEMAVEVEVAELLYALVRAAKPELVVEAGTGRGIASVFLAEALRDNGLGWLVSFEPDPAFAQQGRDALAGLPAEVRQGRSLWFVGRQPDLVFIDSLGDYRREDLEFWLAYEPRPLLVVHDANRDYDLPEGARLASGRGVWMLGTAARPSD